MLQSASGERYCADSRLTSARRATQIQTSPALTLMWVKLCRNSRGLGS